MNLERKSLGRGLSALLGDQKPLPAKDDNRRLIHEIPIGDIHPNPDQPRKAFSPQSLMELSDSIRKRGIIQPVVVRKSPQGFQLIAGERRFRASKIAGLEKVPAIIRETADDEMLELALIENIQRENLNPIDEAKALRMLLDRFGYTQEVLSKRLGISRPYLANALRLLNLPETVKEFVISDKISAGHARAIAGVKDPIEAEKLAELTLSENLSVRSLEEIIRDSKPNQLETKVTSASETKDKAMLIETDESFGNCRSELETIFATKVFIRRKGEAGKIEIVFDDLKTFNRLFNQLTKQ